MKIVGFITKSDGYVTDFFPTNWRVFKSTPVSQVSIAFGA